MTARAENNAQSREAEGDGELPKPFQVQSYADLLKFPEIPAGNKNTPSGNRDIAVPVVDAIVVPTIRPAEQLRPAVQLSAAARCRLLALYTDSFPAGLPSVIADLRPGQFTPLALRSGVQDRLLDLGATLPQSLVSACALDISRKRNLGLLIGHICGWTRMLFLDDDIRKLSVAKLSSAAALLDKYPVVGLQVNKYPDASVVGHARRLTGRRQEPFISGGALLVNPQLLDGFFPPIYHEDWLCVINHIRRGQVAIGGSVGQLPYLPFTQERARLEEFGDTLVSSLLWLVQARNRMSGADLVLTASAGDYWQQAMEPLFWEQILEQRATLIENIAARLKLMSTHDPSALESAEAQRRLKSVQQGLKSVEAARQRCNELTTEEFISFMRKWMNSLGTWQDHLSWLPRVDSVGKALVELGLSHVVRTYEPHREQDVARGIRWTGGFLGRWGRRATADGRGKFGWWTRG